MILIRRPIAVERAIGNRELQTSEHPNFQTSELSSSKPRTPKTRVSKPRTPGSPTSDDQGSLSGPTRVHSFPESGAPRSLQTS